MKIGLIIDAILILIVIINIISGRIKGMVKVLRGFLVPILAILLAMAFHTPATNYIQGMNAFDKIENKVSEIVAEKVPASDTSDVENLTSAEKESVGNLLGQFGVSEEESNALLNGNANHGRQAILDLINHAIAKALAYIAVFIIAVILLSILFAILGGIFRNALLRHADHLLGTVIGGLKGILLVFVIVFVANKASAFLYAIFPSLQFYLSQSRIFTFLSRWMEILL